jgi:hypothetical protein
MKLEILHRLRWLKQMIYTSEISVAGGYHLGNAGDILMGKSVQQLLKKFNKLGSLQTLYNLSKWPKGKKVILGGGAIGYSNPLKELISTYPDPSKVLVLGVDFNESSYSSDLMSYLKAIPVLVTRSEANGKNLNLLLGRNDVLSLPDLGFIWQNENFLANRTNPKEKKLVVNLMPIYMEKFQNSYRPIEQYRNERPEVYSNIEGIFANYLNWAEGIISKYRENGFSIIAIPFTPADEELMLGLSFLKKSEVLNYDSNIFNSLEIIINASTILCTRFHATLIGIRSFSEIIPFAYARKNEELLQSVGISSDQIITPLKMTGDYNSLKNSFKVEPTTVIQLEQKAFNSYYSLVENFLKNQ